MRTPPLIPWRWMVYAAVAILAGVALSGCATVSEDVDFVWATAKASAAPSPNYRPLIVRVDYPHHICSSLGFVVQNGINTIGCADYRGTINAQTCTVFVPKDSPAWLIAHELAHCKYGAWHK